MATTNMGKTKRSTDDMINDAIDRQQSWLDNRRAFTRNFLKRFNVFEKKEDSKKATAKKIVVIEKRKENKNRTVLKAYWFPILCALMVILIALFVLLFKVNAPVKVIAPSVPEPIIRPVKHTVKYNTPSFDLVRIEKTGNIIVAGRNVRESNVSIVINKKVVATVHTNKEGEFVYAPNDTLKPGNYVISLIDAEKNIKSVDSVFVYISEQGYKNSVSLLMTKNGSKVMQAPVLADGDLIVSKIDYLDNGRMVVTGKALPRLRVSLSLNDKYLGFARVSDYKNYGLGADVGELKSGESYKLNIRLHDGEGTVIADIEHKFIMPEMTGDDNTFYTVRRGDCLWVIARNFLRKGILFTMIAERNTIKNPDLIYPDQLLQIPLKD
ncbi:MAG: LysM peptidoglycan-binding domain-containing protein [Alphaproteobacteria bacterium]|nr:LysM peptidoglycan-binding domain-containing protein [Alphaproteobacteria bacterium]